MLRTVATALEIVAALAIALGAWFAFRLLLEPEMGLDVKAAAGQLGLAVAAIPYLAARLAREAATRLENRAQGHGGE